MKDKKTISKTNQTLNPTSKQKLENQVNSIKKSKNKVNHNNFHRALEAFSDCV